MENSHIEINQGLVDVEKETQEYIDAMVAKADQGLNPEPPANKETHQENQQQQQDQSKLLAGKYKNVEELEKGYKELEKKLGSKASVEKQQEQAKDIVESTDLSFDKYTQEFTESGTLSEDSYKELASKGIPKAIVDQYIDGFKAYQELETIKLQNAVYGFVGSEQAYNEIIQWASQNLSEEDIKAFNDTIASGNLAQIKLAVNGLKTSYSASVGNPPKNLLQGYGSTGRDADVYESWAQVTADMNDPRYTRDPAFRRKVQQKLGRSKL